MKGSNVRAFFGGGYHSWALGFIHNVQNYKDLKEHKKRAIYKLLKDKNISTSSLTDKTDIDIVNINNLRIGKEHVVEQPQVA